MVLHVAEPESYRSARMSTLTTAAIHHIIGKSCIGGRAPSLESSDVATGKRKTDRGVE